MKKGFIQLLIIILFTASACYAEDQKSNIDQKPNISVNPQDVPIFYADNPLTGMNSFTLLTALSVIDSEIEKQIKQTIQETLETVGDVTYLKDNDMRGFGTGNVLLIQIGNVTEWNGKEMPISRLSLSVETSVTLNKTDTKTFPIVWSINAFLQGTIDTISEDNLKKAIQKLVGDFVQNYRYANQGQPKKPTFFSYD